MEEFLKINIQALMFKYPSLKTILQDELDGQQYITPEEFIMMIQRHIQRQQINE